MSDIAAVGLDFQTAQAERNMRNVAREATAMGKAVEGAVTSATSKWDAFVQKANESTQRSNATMKALEGIYQRLKNETQQFDRVQKQMGGGLAGAFAAGTAALGLFGIGFGTALNAAVGLYDYLFTQAPKVEETIKEQARLLGLVKDAFRDAGDGAGKFYEQTQSILMLQTGQMIKELQDRIREQSAQIVKGLGQSILQNPMGDYTGMPDLQLDSKLEPFRKAIEDLNDSIASGAPAMDQFRDAIADIGNADPAFAKQATGLLKMSQEASDLVTKFREMEASLRRMQGVATPADYDRLGIKPPVQGPPAPPRVAGGGGADPFESAIISSNKRLAAMRAEADAMGQSAGAHAQLRMEAQLLEAAQQRGGTATEQQMRRIRELGLVANETATRLAQARIDDQIRFGRQTAFLSQEDVAIASQLRDLYPDVSTALGSVAATALRPNGSLVPEATQDNEPAEQEDGDELDTCPAAA